MADHHLLPHHQQQQFCLRWNNHGSTLVAVFDNLLASESLVDVTLFAEGHLLKAHKVVLSACSPYFQTLFAQTTDKHPIVILKDVKHDELKALLEYMYRGEVNVAQDQLGPLIKTAESLKIKGLADGSSSSSSSSNGNGKVSDGGDLRSSHPAGLELPKSDGEGKSSRTTLNSSFPLPQVPQVSVPSVLSTVLTMPPALSLASSTLVPPIKLPSLSQSAGTPTDGSSSHEDNDSPLLQRRKRMRRKSGETCESGDSDGRSSGSPGGGGEGIHLPRIPATITPVVVGGPHHHNFHREHHQHQQQREQQLKERERELERERERSMERDPRDQEGERDSGRTPLELSEQQFRPSSPPSPENLVGSSRGSVVDVPRSSSPGSITARSHLEYDRTMLSPNKALALLGRPPEENSSDANHMSDDEYDYKPSMPVHESHPDTPGPSTSRPRPDDSHKPGNYLGWPYPPDTSGTSEDSYSALENANQGNDYPQVSNAWFESSVCSANLSDPFYSFASPAAAPLPPHLSSSSSSYQQTTSAALGLLTAHSFDSTQSLAEFSFLRNVQSLGATNPYSSAMRNLELVKALAQRAVVLSLQNSAKGLSPPFPPAGRLLQCSSNEGGPALNGNDGKYLHGDAGPANGGGHANHINNNNNNNSSSSSTSVAHGGEMYTCNRCGKAYGVRRSLYRHQKFECGVEPKFPCPVCDKRCSHKFNLKQHIMSHHKHITTP